MSDRKLAGLRYLLHDAVELAYLCGRELRRRGAREADEAEESEEQ